MKKSIFVLSVACLLFSCTSTNTSSSIESKYSSSTSESGTSETTTQVTTQTTTSDNLTTSEQSNSSSESISAPSSESKTSQSNEIYENPFDNFLEEQNEYWSLTNGEITNEIISADSMLKVTGNQEAKSNYFSFKTIQNDFKMSFNLAATSSTKNAFGIKFYDENGEQFTRLKFDTTKIKYSNNNTNLGNKFKENVWFDVDFIFKVVNDSFHVDFYLNGEKLGSDLTCDKNSLELSKINFYTDSNKTGYSYYVNELTFSRNLEIELNAPKDPLVEEESEFPLIDEVGEKINIEVPTLKNDIIYEHENEQDIPSNAIFCTPSDFDSKMKTLKKGMVLVLEDGNYSNNTIYKLKENGSKDEPIIVMARHVGKAIFTGNIQFQIGDYNSTTHLSSGGDYYLFNGLKFKDGIAPSSGIFKIYGTHCRLTNIIIDNHDQNSEITKSLWIQIMSTGKYCEVDHCTFINKKHSTGVLLYLEKNQYDNNPNYAYIHNNYFGNYQNPDPEKYTNELETIRIGVSGGEGDSYSIIENNIFENITSEPELISIKSQHNLIKGNLIIKCTAAITLRQGAFNIVQDNIILNDGIENGNGIRVFGHDQIIQNNLISGIPYNSSTFYGGIVLHNGSGDNVTGSGQCTTNNSKIINNTFLNNYFNLCLGDNKYSKTPHNLTLKNNLVYTNYGYAIRQYKNFIASNITYQDEYYYASNIGLVNQITPNGVNYSNDFKDIIKIENGLVNANVDAGAKNLSLLNIIECQTKENLTTSKMDEPAFFTSFWN